MTANESAPDRKGCDPMSTSDPSSLQPENVSGRWRRARDRWQKAERALLLAESKRLDLIAQQERKVGQLRENKQIAWKALYQSVPCAYCGAEVGKPCTVQWPTMHTARAADCHQPLANDGGAA